MNKDVLFRIKAKDSSGKVVAGARRNVLALGRAARQAALGVSAIGLASVAAVAPLVRLASASAKNIDEQQKFADSINISQRELVGLQLAASETAGITESRLNKSLSDMTRRLGEAREGTGAASDALDVMGLSANQLSRTGTVEQFKAIAAGIRELPTAAEQATVAYDLFGRSGVDLLNTLRQGPGLIEDYIRQADDLGLAVSRIDAKKIEMANDQWGKAKKAVAGIGNQIAVVLAPLVGEMAKRFTDAAVEGGGIGVKVSRGFELVIRSVSAVMTAFHNVRLGWLLVKESILSGISALVNSWNVLINGPLKAINTLLGQDPNIAIFEGLERAALKTEQAAFEAKAEMFKLLDSPPSTADELIAKVNELTAEFNAAAKAATAAQEALQGGLLADPSGEGEGGGSGEEGDSQSGLKGVLAFLGGDAEVEKQAFEARLEVLNSALNDRLISQARYTDLTQQLEVKHQKKLAQIQARGDTVVSKIFKGSLTSRLQALQQFSAGAAQHSRKMFKINKVAAIANAVISTAQGAAQALKDVSFPANIAAAALVVASGAAQINAIRGTSFQGGGGGTTPSAAASTPVINDTPVQDTTAAPAATEEDQNEGAQPVQLVLDGELLAEVLIPRISKKVNEEDFELISPDSRNASDIVSTGGAG